MRPIVLVTSLIVTGTTDEKVQSIPYQRHPFRKDMKIPRKQYKEIIPEAKKKIQKHGHHFAGHAEATKHSEKKRER
jgi:hypothetical protein